jgi:3-dehydroquinate synthase class II
MCSWRTVSVSQLAVGDSLFVFRQPAARHTGIAVQEACTER